MYGGGLGVYKWGMVKVIKKKKEVKSCVIIEELGRILFKGLENVIGRGGRKKVGVVLGFEELRELKGEYGEKEGGVMM